MQDTVSVNNRPSRGTIIAEEGRKLCNNLSPAERQRLLQSAMAIIYGQKARDPHPLRSLPTGQQAGKLPEMAMIAGIIMGIVLTVLAVVIALQFVSPWK